MLISPSLITNYLCTYDIAIAKLYEVKCEQKNESKYWDKHLQSHEFHAMVNILQGNKIA